MEALQVSQSACARTTSMLRTFFMLSTTLAGLTERSRSLYCCSRLSNAVGTGLLGGPVHGFEASPVLALFACLPSCASLNAFAVLAPDPEPDGALELIARISG